MVFLELFAHCKKATNATSIDRAHTLAFAPGILCMELVVALLFLSFVLDLSICHQFRAYHDIYSNRVYIHIVYIRIKCYIGYTVVTLLVYVE